MGVPGAHGPRPDSCQAGRRETTASAGPEGARAAVTSAPGGTPRDQPPIWSGHDPETAARGNRRIRGLQTSGADNAAASDAGYCCIYNVLEIFMVLPAPQMEWKNTTISLYLQCSGCLHGPSSTSNAMEKYNNIVAFTMFWRSSWPLQHLKCNGNVR